VTEKTAEVEERVIPLELFFDLVFVFAITQVTSYMSDNLSWNGVGEGLLILAAVWWAWAAYAWLTNSIDADEISARLSMFAAMAAMLVLSLTIPQAFGDEALTFAVAYAIVRVLHIVVHGQAVDDSSVRRAVKRLAPTSFIGPSLLILAAFLDGTPQTLMWIAALLIDYAGPAIVGVSEWKIFPEHFAERHGLIIIIALGESIVAVGIGASGTEVDAPVIIAAALGVVVAACLWWAYFDVVAIVAERKLHEVEGPARNRMARDSFSYLHLPMIAGIVLLALGMKKTLAKVDKPLDDLAAIALCGGVALYLLAHIAFRLRNVRSLSVQRLVTAGVLLALIPVAMAVDALVALAIVAAVCAALIAFEAIHLSDARARVRDMAAPRPSH
jgi:low temperature requirement protein LtrA